MQRFRESIGLQACFTESTATRPTTFDCFNSASTCGQLFAGPSGIVLTSHIKGLTIPSFVGAGTFEPK